MTRYRKRPVVVDAIQFTGKNVPEIAQLLDWDFDDGDGDCDTIIIETLNGDVTVTAGEWIVRGIAGEGYPCRADLFELTYEPIDEEGEE